MIRTRAGEYLGLSLRFGVMGPLSFPSPPLWLEVLSDDRLIAADSRGNLWLSPAPRSPSWQAAWTRHWAAPVGFVADAAGGWLAVADRDRVHIAHYVPEGPLAFETSVPRRDVAVSGLFVRHDGTVVANLHLGGPRTLPETHVWSAARGWRRSVFQPGELTRRGSWVGNRDASCRVVLAQDGRTWIRVARGAGPTVADWLPLARLGSKPQSPDHVALDTDRYPVAPRRGSAPPAPDCTPSSIAAPVLERAPRTTVRRASKVADPEASCGPLICVTPPAHFGNRPTPTSFALFAHGSTGRGEAAMVPPTMAVAHRKSGRLTTVHLPLRCAPRHLLSVRGMAIVLCGERDARHSIYVAEAARPSEWRFEGRLKGADVSDVSVSSDGTVLLHTPCERSGACLAYVRRPLQLGATDAWRAVEHPGARLFRVGFQGNLVAVSQGSHPAGLTLTLLRPFGGDRSVAVDLPVAASATRVDVDVAVTRDGRVRIRLGDSAKGFSVAADGTLVPENGSR